MMNTRKETDTKGGDGRRGTNLGRKEGRGTKEGQKMGPKTLMCSHSSESCSPRTVHSETRVLFALSKS